MHLENWTSPESDPLRRRRLVAGYGVGVIVVGLAGLGIGLSSRGVEAASREDVLDVTLAAEVEPEPDVVEQKAPLPEARPKPKPRAMLAQPVEISNVPPPEAEPVPDLDKNAPDPFEDAEPGPAEPEKPPSVAQAPPAPPAPKPRVVPKPSEAPVRITEEMTPPKCTFHVEYPSAQKAAGVEGVVVAKVTVSATGAVSEITILKGPPEFHQAVKDALARAKCTPALSADQTAVSVTKRFRIPFKIKVR